MQIELRQLRAFVAVAETGSFTRAASELFLSQASVSRAVASLETTVGARLLRRTTRRDGVALRLPLISPIAGQVFASGVSDCLIDLLNYTQAMRPPASPAGSVL